MPNAPHRDPAPNPIDLIRRRARRLVVAPPDESGIRLVYAITHVRNIEVTSASVVEAKKLGEAQAQAQHLENRLARCKTDEERSRVQEEQRALQERLQADLAAELLSSPDMQREYIARLQRIVAQCIEAVGIAYEDPENTPPAKLRAPETGPQPFGTTPEQICLPLDETGDVYLRPLRVVIEGEPNRDKGEVSIHDYTLTETKDLAFLFLAAFSVASTVSPLPGSPRAAELGGQDGAAVRPAPEPVSPRSRSGGRSARRSR